MTQRFDDLVSSEGESLLEVLHEIPEALEKYKEDGSDLDYDEDLFAEYLRERLTDAELLSIPANMQTDEYLLNHSWTTKYRGSQIRIFGSGMFRDGLGGYHLHLFISDYKYRDELEELEPKEALKLAQEAWSFQHYSKDGRLLKGMDPSAPVYRAAQAIHRYADDIRSVRVWIFTNRVWSDIHGAGRLPVKDDGVETVAQVVDLWYMSGLDKGAIEINQSFQKIGGLPCIACSSEGQDYDCYFSHLTGNALASLYSLHGTSLVAANVRAYLGENKINKRVQETIREEPERFLAYNNGLVISADRADLGADGKIERLYGLQIINGGQTTANIYRVWLAARNVRIAEVQRKYEAAVEMIRVPVKIVVPHKNLTADERAELRSKISAAANSQNAVKVSDLSSNQPFQIHFEHMVKNLTTPDGKQWFYQRARGAYEAEIEKRSGMGTSKRDFQVRYPAEKLFGKLELAMAMLAWEGDSVSCAKGQEQAFSVYAARWDGIDETEIKSKVSKDVIKQMICKRILFRTLEKGAKKALKDAGINNARVPVIYAIAVFAEMFGNRLHWDRIWNRQALSQGLENALIDLTVQVGRVIVSQMGGMMIAMWGRQAKCGEMLRKELHFNPSAFNDIYELK